MEDLGKEAFEYLNKIRILPKIAILPLEERLKRFKGKNYMITENCSLQTQEGADAVRECIEFLKVQQSVQPFEWSEGLSKAARDHVFDIGSKGITGSTGSDGSTMSDRIERYGDWSGRIAENSSYGSKTGQDVILSFLINDGQLNRGLRANCFKTHFKYVGISSWPHTTYEQCWVFYFAEEYTPKPWITQSQTSSQFQQKQYTVPQAPIYKEPTPPQKSSTTTSYSSKVSSSSISSSGYEQPGQPKQQTKQPTQLNEDYDPNKPPNCVSTNTTKETTIKNGKKHVKITRVYKLKDGSTQTSIVESYEE